MAKLIKFATRLFCPKCEQISIRVFDKFLPPGILNPAAYVLLDWLGCQNPECVNYFPPLNNVISRCPVCKLWTVRFAVKTKNPKKEIWKCENSACGWKFQDYCF